MGWSSFTAITDLIKSALENSAALSSFCIVNFDRAQAVRKAFQKREEIPLTDLPLIIITSPSLRNEYGAGRLLYRTHGVRLYAGFQQEDRAQAQDNIIKFEENIEQALLNDAGLNAQNIEIYVGDSANDEGFFHPVYFLAKDFKVLVAREV